MTVRCHNLRKWRIYGQAVLTVSICVFPYFCLPLCSIRLYHVTSSKLEVILGQSDERQDRARVCVFYVYTCPDPLKGAPVPLYLLVEAE